MTMALFFLTGTGRLSRTWGRCATPMTSGAVLAGRAQGVHGAYVLTEHGRHHRDEVPAGVPVFEGISGAAALIMAEAGERAASERREDG